MDTGDARAVVKVRWGRAASDQYREIIEFLAKDYPPAAQRVAQRLFNAIESLKNLPYRGRGGRAGTRELICYPYIVEYRVMSDVEILRIRHGAQLQ